MKKLSVIVDEYRFMMYLKLTIKQLILKSFEAYKCKNIDNYLNILGIDLTCNEIIKTGANNLIITQFPTYYVIEINKNNCIKNYRIYDLCKLINDGNIDIQGYPIFTQVLSFIENHIDLIYKNWSEENVY